MAMAAYPRVGSTIKIKTNDGDYEGQVKRIQNNFEQIALNDVISSVDGNRFVGLQFFYGHEIHDWELIKDVSISEPTPIKKRIILPPIPFGQSQVKTRQDDGSLSDDDFEGDGSDNSDNEELEIQNYVKNGTIDWKSIGINSANTKLSLPLEYQIIDDLSETFHNAIKDIKTQKMIGVSLEGLNIGRAGELFWLNISTKSKVYLFDIHLLRQNGFEEGLKSILESAKVVKIFHDCRLASDILFSQFSVHLSSNQIKDTQVGDFTLFCRGNKQKTMPEQMKDLCHCLSDYLPDCILSKGAVHGGEWEIRPLLSNLKDAAIKSVALLYSLWTAIQERLDSDFMQGMEIYLRTVRDSNDEELALKLVNPIFPPMEMNRLVSKPTKFLFSMHNYRNPIQERNVFITPQISIKSAKSPRNFKPVDQKRVYEETQSDTTENCENSLIVLETPPEAKQINNVSVLKSSANNNFKVVPMNPVATPTNQAATHKKFNCATLLKLIKESKNNSDGNQSSRSGNQSSRSGSSKDDSPMNIVRVNDATEQVLYEIPESKTPNYNRAKYHFIPAGMGDY